MKQKAPADGVPDFVGLIDFVEIGVEWNGMNLFLPGDQLPFKPHYREYNAIIIIHTTGQHMPYTIQYIHYIPIDFARNISIAQ